MAQGQRVPLASPKYWLNQKYLNQWKSIRDLSPGTNHGSKSFIGADMASDGTSWPCEAWLEEGGQCSGNTIATWVLPRLLVQGPHQSSLCLSSWGLFSWTLGHALELPSVYLQILPGWRISWFLDPDSEQMSQSSGARRIQALPWACLPHSHLENVCRPSSSSLPFTSQYCLVSPAIPFYTTVTVVAIYWAHDAYSFIHLMNSYETPTCVQHSTDFWRHNDEKDK